MIIPFDYVTLRVMWWILLGLILVAFLVMDGFDLGIGILFYYVGRTNSERRVVLNSIGPVWEGNQVWLVLGAGALFAAWPEIYAVSFSGFYFVMLLILFALILRPVGFKYRSKVDHTYWRTAWDVGIFISGLVPAFMVGVIIANVFQGVPFYFDRAVQSFYTGTFIELFNPFAWLCGITSILMLATHGSTFLSIKTTGEIQRRAMRATSVCAVLTIALFALCAYWICYRVQGYVVTGTMLLDAPSSPFHKTVMREGGGWLTNYKHYPELIWVPVCAVMGILFSVLLTRVRFFKMAWCFSALGIVSIMASVGASLFPFILPSLSHPDMSLLVWDASSSQMTLFIMLIVSAIFLPMIVLYTGFVYYVLRGKVTQDEVEQNTRQAY